MKLPISEKIAKILRQPPKLQFIPHKQTAKEKRTAKMLEQLINYTYDQYVPHKEYLGETAELYRVSYIPRYMENWPSWLITISCWILNLLPFKIMKFNKGDRITKVECKYPVRKI